MVGEGKWADVLGHDLEGKAVKSGLGVEGEELGDTVDSSKLNEDGSLLAPDQ